MANFGTIPPSTTEQIGFREKRSKWAYMAIGMFVVAFAGVSAMSITTSANRLLVVGSVEMFDAAQGDMATCDKTADGFIEALPKFDAAYSKNVEDFYNACYYSYRCCTSTYSGCYVSENFGDLCRDCLEHNAPRMVRGICESYMNKIDVYGEPWTAQMEETEDDVPIFEERDILEDTGFPETNLPQFKLKFCEYSIVRGEVDAKCSGGGYPDKVTDKEDLKTCWAEPGAQDKRTLAYVDKCFEVISWCNLLCPRDEANTKEHAMCKHCTLFGFQSQERVVDKRKQAVQEALQSIKNEAFVKDQMAKADWENKFSF